MNVVVHSKTVPVTKAMRRFIEKQAGKVNKLSHKINQFTVFLENRRNHAGLSIESKVNVKLSIPGKDILASAKADNLYTAVNEAMEDAVRGLRKRKERFMSRRQVERRAKRAEKIAVN